MIAPRTRVPRRVEPNVQKPEVQLAQASIMLHLAGLHLEIDPRGAKLVFMKKRGGEALCT